MTTADLSPLYNNLLCVGRGLPCQPFLLLPSRGWSDSSTSNSAPGTRSQGEPSSPHRNTAANSEHPTCTMSLTKPYGPVPGASSWSWPKSNAPGFCSWALYSCLSWHRHGWDQVVVAFSTWEVQAEQKGWLWGPQRNSVLEIMYQTAGGSFGRLIYVWEELCLDQMTQGKGSVAAGTGPEYRSCTQVWGSPYLLLVTEAMNLPFKRSEAEDGASSEMRKNLFDSHSFPKSGSSRGETWHLQGCLGR